MKNKKLHAEVNTTNYKGIYEVVEILGKIIALKVNGQTTDFIIKEIERFCDSEGNNINYKF